MRVVSILAVLALCACDPQAVADQAMQRTAASVVKPVLAQNLPGPVADKATQCLLDAATPDEIRGLARDVGVEAGSRTVQNIRNLSTHPDAQACLKAGGVPPLNI